MRFDGGGGGEDFPADVADERWIGGDRLRVPEIDVPERFELSLGRKQSMRDIRNIRIQGERKNLKRAVWPTSWKFLLANIVTFLVVWSSEQRAASSLLGENA